MQDGQVLGCTAARGGRAGERLPWQTGCTVTGEEPPERGSNVTP